MKMPETIRKDPVQDVEQSFEDNEIENEQLPTSERSLLHDDTTELIEITHQQIRSKTPEVIQTGLKESRHQEVNNLHTGMKAPQSFENSQSFDRQRVGNFHTGMRGPQSFGRQQSPQFRTSQPYQSAIPTTSRMLFSLPREKESFNEPTRPLINPIEPRRHSTGDVPRVEIHSPPSRNLMNQIDEISTEQTSLEITDIFERLNIADKIEKAKKIAKEKGKAKDQKDQFKPSKPPSSRPIGSSDLDPTNIIENKRNRKPNPKYAQLVYEE